MAKYSRLCCSSILPYSRSGAYNVEKIANLTALKLSDREKDALTCAIALGGGKSGFIESAKMTERNAIIDGCPVSCVKSIFERHGITNYEHHIVTDCGIRKGARQAESANEVALVAGKIDAAICKPAG